MAKQYKSKVFKSGNSVALRLPKALGIRAGSTMILREAHGRYIVEPEREPDRKIDLSGLYGAVTGLERLPLEERDRAWSAALRRDG